MISLAPPRRKAGVLARLGAELSAAGYADFCGTFHPLTPRLESWLRHRDDAPPDLRALIDLFLLANPVRLGDLPRGLRSAAVALTDAGVLITGPDDTVRTRGVVLLPVLGYWLFFQRPTLRPTLYFGDDSMALATRLMPRPGGATLDLCAGPGIQSLVASGISASVTAVEVNPAAAELACLNVAINGREGCIEVVTGDLYEPLDPGVRFDHIVANPPLLPVLPELRYPFVGDGGPDGLAVTRRILDGLPARLASDGSAQVIGTCLSDGLLPFAADWLATWCRDTAMDAHLTIAAHVSLKPGSPMFEGMVVTASAVDQADRYAGYLRERGASHLATFHLGVRFGQGRMTLLDLSRDEQPGLWYV